MNPEFTKERIERVARMYHCGVDASTALGITTRSFTRLCRKYEIETPWMRKRRQRGDARRQPQSQAA